LSLGNASAGQKAGLAVVGFLILIAVANGGDSEADDTARPRSGSGELTELASPAIERGPRLTYSRRRTPIDNEYKAPERREPEYREPQSSPSNPPPSEDTPRLTYVPKNDAPITPSVESSPPATTVQQTSEAVPAAPTTPGRTASGGAPVGELARTGAAAGITAVAGVGLVYMGSSLRDRIKRARRRPWGRKVPAPGEAHPASLVLQERPK
jgi:hypothetical protein